MVTIIRTYQNAVGGLFEESTAPLPTSKSSAHQKDNGQRKRLEIDEQAVPQDSSSRGSNTFQMGLVW